MWHEARKQERKIRGMLVDYRKRAERRRDFYEKIKADPTQFLQIHGRQCKIHLDPAIAAAAEGPATMMPWQGQNDNLIDRFDVRAHLDFIPPVAAKVDEDATSEERQLNYERYRIIAQNAFLGINEEKFLKQLHLEEQFGYTENEPKKKKPTGGAAIGFTYEDSTGTCSSGTSYTAAPNMSGATLNEEDGSEENSDSDLDVDLSINISKIDSAQAHEMNRHGRNFGMSSNDFYSYLTNDLEEAECFKLAKEEEHEKALFSGRKSRRERRAHREKRNANRKISPPSYAAKETAIVGVEMHEKSESRSPSPENSGKITFITSFGDDEEPQLPVKTTYADKVKFGTKLKKLRQENCDRKVFLDPNRREPISFKRNDVGRERERERVTPRNSSRRSTSRSRKIPRRSRRSSTSSSSRSSRSRSRASRSRSHSRRSRNSPRSKRRRMRRRSTSSSSNSSTYYARERRRNLLGGSRSSSSSRSRVTSRSSRSRSKARSSKSRSRSRSTSSSSSSRGPSMSRGRSKSRSKSKSKSQSRSPAKKIEEPQVVLPQLAVEMALEAIEDKVDNSKDNSKHDEVMPKTEDTLKVDVKPLPRYYGRKKSDQSSSEIGDSSDEDSTESPKNSLTNNSNLKIGNTGTTTKGGAKSSATVSLAERLKRKRQALLNKQFKADKIAEQIKTEREKQEQQTREDELRELALKLRRKQRERRHAYDSDSSDSSSRSTRSKSASVSPKTKRSRSRSPSPAKKDRRREREREDYSRRHAGSSRDYDRERERERERDKDRDYERDRERAREKSRSRDREREREREERYRRSSLRNDDRYYKDERRRGDGRDGRARDNQNPRRSLVDY